MVEQEMTIEQEMSVEKWLDIFDEGNVSLKELSKLPVQDVIQGIETIWKGCKPFMKKVENAEGLEKEYEDRTVIVTYKNGGTELESIEIKWSCWDSMSLKLTSVGLEVKHSPEHGSDNIFVIPWILLIPYYRLQFA